MMKIDTNKIKPEAETCPKCAGYKKLECGDICPTCDGTGVVWKAERRPKAGDSFIKGV